MVDVFLKQRYTEIKDILKNAIDMMDICKLFFDDYMPDIFLNKGLNNMSIISHGDKTIGCFMFSFNETENQITSYLYMISDISETDAYHILYGFLNNYFKLRQNKYKLTVDLLDRRIYKMKHMYLVPFKFLNEIDESYSDEVNSFMSIV